MDRARAEKIAKTAIVELSRDIDMPIEMHNDMTIERRLAWVFFYNSKEYIETGDYRSALLGAGPVVVYKADGRVVCHGGVPPVEDILASLL